jgi:hypothetical protein
VRVRVGGGGAPSADCTSAAGAPARGERQNSYGRVPAGRATSLCLLEAHLHCPCLGFRVQGLVFRVGSQGLMPGPRSQTRTLRQRRRHGGTLARPTSRWHRRRGRSASARSGRRARDLGRLTTPGAAGVRLTRLSR